MPDRRVVTSTVLIVAALVGGLLGRVDRGPIPTVSEAIAGTPYEPPPLGMVTVHVAGWVARPGVIQVPAGTLVADVIALAGGARAGSRLDELNLARPVADGDRIEVPGPGGTGSSASPGESDGLVSVNTADAAELESLPGVGPVLAQRIIDYREANGPFTVVEDLLDVSGIGEAILSSIRDLIAVP